MIVNISRVILIVVGICSLTVLGGAAFFALESRVGYEQPLISLRSSSLPVNSFSEKGELLNNQLHYAPPSLRVPNLSTVLSYHGVNVRPDISPASKEMFFSLAGVKDPFAVKGGEKVYLKVEEGSYTLSQGQKPTSLWFTAIPKGSQALVSVRIEDQNGVISSEPASAATLQLPEKPLPVQAAIWSLGDFRVDGTYFIRNKARWYGRDLFLENHGGEEYQQLQGKQRFSIGEGENRYYLYGEVGDLFVFRDGRFYPVQPGENSKGLPLLQIVKQDDKVLSFHLFSSTGVQKTLLNLVKAQDPLTEQFMENFQFVGMRTKVHALFKVSGKREVVGPGDWFINGAEGLRKIKTGKELDQYISGDLTGSLLVIESLTQNGEEKQFQATLYSPERSASVALQIPLEPFQKAAAPSKKEEQPPAVESEESG